MMMTLPRRIAFPVVAGFAAVFMSACGKPPQAVQPPPPEVTIEPARGEQINEWDAFTGRMEAVDSVEIRARVSGYLTEVRFKEGSVVSKGDVLFVIDQRPYQNEVARTESSLAQAKAQLEQADNDFKRAQALIKSHNISQETYEARATSAAASAASVQAAAAEVAQARLNLEFTEVKSPVDGRTSRAQVTVGNLVTADSTLLTTVVSQDPIYVYFDADERSLLKYMAMVREGTRENVRETEIPVQLGLANEDGYPHKGMIDFVDNAIDPVTGTMRARGRFDNGAHYFTPGMFARVRVQGDKPYPGVLVRDMAIGFDQSQKYVMVVNSKNVAEYRVVETGPLQDGGMRVIRKGLNPGENVIVNGLQRVRPGVTVKPQPFKSGDGAPAKPAEGAAKS